VIAATAPTDREIALDALKHLHVSRAVDRDDWLRVGMALHAVDSSAGMCEAWDAFSKRGGDKYREGESAKQWAGFKRGGGIRLGTLIDMAKADSGGAFDPRPDTRAKSNGKANINGHAYPTRAAAERAAGDAVAREKGERWPLAARHEYPEVRAAVLRFESPAGDDKSFRPIHRLDDGWHVAAPPGLWSPYGVSELRPEGTARVLEGEKCRDTAQTILNNCIASAHGAQSPRKTDWSAIRDRDVIIYRDHDEDGLKYANTVAEILTGNGCHVRVLLLPNLPPGGDIVEYLDELDGREADEIRQGLEALETSAPMWQPTDKAKADQGEGGSPLASPVLVCMRDIHPELVRWHWKQRVARGKLTVLAGDPGLGKSFVTIYMASVTSRGGCWTDLLDEPIPAGGVVLLSAEDDLNDTIRPRLDAAGADVDRITALRAVRHRDRDTGKELELPFDLTTDLSALEQAILATPECSLVVVDPISAYMGTTDSHSNSEVRGVLAPLSELAAKYRVAVVCVSHLNKGNASAVYRVMGSLAFAAAARAVWGVVKDKADPDRRLMLPFKNNLGNDKTGLAYSLSDAGLGIPSVCWEAQPVTTSADEALDPDRKPDAAPKRDKAVAWLRALLDEGPVLSESVKSQADACGFSWATIRRAADDIGVVPIKDKSQKSGPWSWVIPGFVKGVGAQ
jgi:hypothetical protein